MVGKRILSTVHSQIAILHQEGYSSRQIAQRLSLVQSTVVRSLKSWQATGKFGYNKPSGCPKCTTNRMDISIKAARKSPRKSAVSIMVCLPPGNRPSSRTIQRRQFNSELQSYTLAKKPVLSAKNVKDHLAFCNKYRHWTDTQWQRVMCSDKSMISQFYALPDMSDVHPTQGFVIATSSQPLRMLRNLWCGVPLVRKEEVVCGSCLKEVPLMELFILMF